MKKRQRAVLGIITLLTIGVLLGVHVMYEEAYAVIPMTVHFDWGFTPGPDDNHITGVSVVFLNGNGNPVAGGGNLAFVGQDDAWHTTWSNSFTPNSQAVSVRFTASSVDYTFSVNPQTMNLDWSNGNWTVMVVSPAP